jgi:hypothetical protein
VIPQEFQASRSVWTHHEVLLGPVGNQGASKSYCRMALPESLRQHP